MSSQNRHPKAKIRGGVSKSPRSSELRGLLANIVESSDDAIFSRTLDGTITSWNAAAEQIFGYSAGEIVGLDGSVLLPKDRRDETEQLLQRARHGIRVEHYETIRQTKGGAFLTVSLTVSPLRGARGRVIGASTIARDITAQRQLEQELIEVGELERKRVGRDLHDGLGQQLGGIELLCRTMVRTLARRGLPEIRTARLLVKMIQEATVQTRAIAHGLDPVMDSPDGLMVALENLAGTARSVFRIRCSFQCEEPVLIAGHGTAVHLFRIAQEAVSNAIRHGRARRLEILLSRANGRLLLEIRDNGRGFPARQKDDPGMGIRTMRYRAASLGGGLKVGNAASAGAFVRCSIPLPRYEKLAR